ncbi:MAG: hypothetical protein ACQESB_06100, partial [Elusimicrobiota bacterium]
MIEALQKETSIPFNEPAVYRAFLKNENLPTDDTQKSKAIIQAHQHTSAETYRNHIESELKKVRETIEKDNKLQNTIYEGILNAVYRIKREENEDLDLYMINMPMALLNKTEGGYEIGNRYMQAFYQAMEGNMGPVFDTQGGRILGYFGTSLFVLGGSYEQVAERINEARTFAYREIEGSLTTADKNLIKGKINQINIGSAKLKNQEIPEGAENKKGYAFEKLSLAWALTDACEEFPQYREKTRHESDNIHLISEDTYSDMKEGELAAFVEKEKSGKVYPGNEEGEIVLPRHVFGEIEKDLELLSSKDDPAGPEALAIRKRIEESLLKLNYMNLRYAELGIARKNRFYAWIKYLNGKYKEMGLSEFRSENTTAVFIDVNNFKSYDKKHKREGLDWKTDRHMRDILRIITESLEEEFKAENVAVTVQGDEILVYIKGSEIDKSVGEERLRAVFVKINNSLEEMLNEKKHKDFIQEVKTPEGRLPVYNISHEGLEYTAAKGENKWLIKNTDGNWEEIEVDEKHAEAVYANVSLSFTYAEVKDMEVENPLQVTRIFDLMGAINSVQKDAGLRIGGAREHNTLIEQRRMNIIRNYLQSFMPKDELSAIINLYNTEELLNRVSQIEKMLEALEESSTAIQNRRREIYETFLKNKAKGGKSLRISLAPIRKKDGASLIDILPGILGGFTTAMVTIALTASPMAGILAGVLVFIGLLLAPGLFISPVAAYKPIDNEIVNNAAELLRDNGFSHIVDDLKLEELAESGRLRVGSRTLFYLLNFLGIQVNAFNLRGWVILNPSILEDRDLAMATIIRKAGLISGLPYDAINNLIKNSIKRSKVEIESDFYQDELNQLLKDILPSLKQEDLSSLPSIKGVRYLRSYPAYLEDIMRMWEWISPEKRRKIGQIKVYPWWHPSALRSVIINNIIGLCGGSEVTLILLSRRSHFRRLLLHEFTHALTAEKELIERLCRGKFDKEGKPIRGAVFPSKYSMFNKAEYVAELTPAVAFRPRPDDEKRYGVYREIVSEENEQIIINEVFGGVKEENFQFDNKQGREITFTESATISLLLHLGLGAYLTGYLPFYITSLLVLTMFWAPTFFLFSGGVNRINSIFWAPYGSDYRSIPFFPLLSLFAILNPQSWMLPSVSGVKLKKFSLTIPVDKINKKLLLALGVVFLIPLMEIFHGTYYKLDEIIPKPDPIATEEQIKKVEIILEKPDDVAGHGDGEEEKEPEGKIESTVLPWPDEFYVRGPGLEFTGERHSYPPGRDMELFEKELPYRVDHLATTFRNLDSSPNLRHPIGDHYKTITFDITSDREGELSADLFGEIKRFQVYPGRSSYTLSIYEFEISELDRISIGAVLNHETRHRPRFIVHNVEFTPVGERDPGIQHSDQQKAEQSSSMRAPDSPEGYSGGFIHTGLLSELAGGALTAIVTIMLTASPMAGILA